MNFRYINPHNVRWFIPSWAIDPFDLAKALDDLIGQQVKLTGHKPRWDKSVGFWIECELQGDEWKFHLITVGDDGAGKENLNRLFISTDEWVINISLPEMIKGAPPAVGTHSLYHHHFEADVPAGYIGITKQRWFDRYSQHLSSARTGSPYLFHRNIRENVGKRAYHYILLSIVNEEAALHYEEEFVQMGTLYPLGLNMIPGGKAGIRYLHKLGSLVRSVEDRDLALQDLMGRETVEGKPNPLCAARWETDPDYAARVICGHSGRLTAEQVRKIRLMSVAGHAPAAIATEIGDRVKRVSSVLAGQRYGRVA